MLYSPYFYASFYLVFDFLISFFSIFLWSSPILSLTHFFSLYSLFHYLFGYWFLILLRFVICLYLASCDSFLIFYVTFIAYFCALLCFISLILRFVSLFTIKTLLRVASGAWLWTPSIESCSMKRQVTLKKMVINVIIITSDHLGTKFLYLNDSTNFKSDFQWSFHRRLKIAEFTIYKRKSSINSTYFYHKNGVLITSIRSL